MTGVPIAETEPIHVSRSIMLQAPFGSYSPGESGARNIVASWVIALLLLSMGGLFIGIHDRDAPDSPRVHPALSLALSSAIEDALVW
jgi:hypothetical protein